MFALNTVFELVKQWLSQFCTDLYFPSLLKLSTNILDSDNPLADQLVQEFLLARSQLDRQRLCGSHCSPPSLQPNVFPDQALHRGRKAGWYLAMDLDNTIVPYLPTSTSVDSVGCCTSLTESKMVGICRGFLSHGEVA
jgi:hypothetical protein